MFNITVDIDELTLQEAAAALNTKTAAETVERALLIATEFRRGERLAARRRRLARSGAWRQR